MPSFQAGTGRGRLRAAFMSKFASICFIYPDRGRGARYDRMFPPLGLEMVAAGVRGLVRERVLIDLRFDKHWETLVPPDVDLAALSLLWDTPVEQLLGVVARLRQMRPDVRVVAGGRVAEAHRRVLVTAPAGQRVDVVFCGPDDGRFRRFVETGQPESLTGVAFLREGRYCETAMLPWGPIPDTPLPDRSLRRHRYGMIRRDGLDLGIATDAIQSSRGCPYRCAFCTFNRDAQGRHLSFSGRSAESVVDELADIDAPYVVFTDDNVCHDVQRMERLCDLLIERRIGKTYGIETRVNVGMRPQLVEKMCRAGFRHVTFGLESMHDHLLKFLNKDLRRRTIETAFSRVRNLPMFFIGNFIIGNVGETREQMLEIPGFARKIGLDSIQVHHLRCRGPEPLTEAVRETPGYHIDDRTGKVYSDAISLADMREIRRRIKRGFWTPGQALRAAWKVKRLMKPVGFSSVAWHWLSWEMAGRPDAWGDPASSGTQPGERLKTC